MIVDSSAIVAMLKDEPTAPTIQRALVDAEHLRISAGTLVESSIVVDGSMSIASSREFDALLARLDIHVEPVTHKQAQIASAAYQSFGKGSPSKAQLNFGDCFSYALAADTGEPLLYVAQGFAHTSIRSALDDVT